MAFPPRFGHTEALQGLRDVFEVSSQWQRQKAKSAAGKNNNIVESRNIIVDSDTQPFPTSVESEDPNMQPPMIRISIDLDPELNYAS